jgi:DNA polymerase-3 subunit delta'
MSAQRQISSSKKIFLISTNSFQLEAQNALLKLFEEPIENTHFFVITPDSNALIKTFVSRFYFISTKQNLVEEQADAEKFLSMHLSQRVEFIKSLLVEPEDEILDESTRRKALKFLNELERVLHGKFTKAKLYSKESTDFFNQIFKAREFLRQPGSSAKSLMESVALCVPVL